MARKIFRAYKDARRYDGWSGEVDPNLGQHEELLYTKVWLDQRSLDRLSNSDYIKFTFRIMITAVLMKMQILDFSAQKTVHVALVEKDREKEDRGRRVEVGETEDEIGRKQEGIDVIKKKMIHLKNNCQRYILIN